MNQTAFKIFTGSQWAEFEASGTFHGAPVDLQDGFIHMSTLDQLSGTLGKHFAGQSGLVIAKIGLTDFGDTLRWEASRGGALFPHLYAPLPMAAVISFRSAAVPARLSALRNVGAAALSDFKILGITSVGELSGCDPDFLFTELVRLTEKRQDPCVWDVFAAAIHEAKTGHAQNWWDFTPLRKVRQANGDFPATKM